MSGNEHCPKRYLFSFFYYVNARYITLPSEARQVLVAFIAGSPTHAAAFMSCDNFREDEENVSVCIMLPKVVDTQR